jgi:hypothetical protein
MASTKSATQFERSAWSKKRLERHKEEVARLREELGDPQEAIFAFTRDRFDSLSFLPDAGRTGAGLESDDDDYLDAW